MHTSSSTNIQYHLDEKRRNMFLSDEQSTLKTLDFTFYISCTPTFYIQTFFIGLPIQQMWKLEKNFFPNSPETGQST